jgi:hypothetical protein
MDEELPPLHSAARDGDIESLKTALQRTMVGERDTWGETAMHWARSTEVASVLVAAGGDVNAVDPTGVSYCTISNSFFK